MFFEQKDVNFAANADDNTPYFCDKNLEVIVSKLQICALKLLELFSNNYMKMNSDKCLLILNSNDVCMYMLFTVGQKLSSIYMNNT